MNLGRILPVAIGVALLALLAWGVTSLLERLTERDTATVVTATPPPPSETPHIAATLFYATAEGDALLPVQREVPLAEGLVAQGRQILTAQFAPPPAPYISAIPPGTMLRAFYVTEKGDAFVDVSGISGPDLGTMKIDRDYEQGLGDAVDCLGQPMTQAGAVLKVLQCQLVRSGLFHLVLSPDYDDAHHDHFHLEVRPWRERAALHASSPAIH